jgi:hypothetical protein
MNSRSANVGAPLLALPTESAEISMLPRVDGEQNRSFSESETRESSGEA